MENFIDHIEIQNFKSIRHLDVSGFKRINLFLGRPNVGKSNLLEALGLFALPYLWNNRKRKLTDLVRLEGPRQLFNEGNFEQTCFIHLKRNHEDLKECCEVYFDKSDAKAALKFRTFIASPNNPWYGSADTFARDGYYPSNQYDVEFAFDSDLKGTKLKRGKGYFAHGSPDFINYIKPYSFSIQADSRKIPLPFLNPPFGENLLHVLELMPDLMKLYEAWFKMYGLRLTSDIGTQTLKILKDKGESVFLLPYSSIADTLQRIIFYKTAVASNENSVLLFEEPEAHAYPPYISEFTHEVVKSKTNQFFIVTHSPIIVEQFLSEAIDDLGIFMVDFRDGQTVVKGLTTDEIKEVYQYGVDLFFNGDSYLD